MLREKTNHTKKIFTPRKSLDGVVKNFPNGKNIHRLIARDGNVLPEGDSNKIKTNSRLSGTFQFFTPSISKPRKGKINLSQKGVALFVVLVLLSTLFFQGSPMSQGATYTWTQLNWVSETSNATGHPAPANWTEYNTKSTNMSAVNGGAELQLSTTAGTSTHTLASDFTGGLSELGTTNVRVAEASNSVRLSVSSRTVSWSANTDWNGPDPDGGANYIAPALVDLDGDGDLDLMAGEDVTGTVYAYRNTGTASSPTWARNAGWDSPTIGAGGDPAPVLADLDNDGDYDMLVGIGAGDVYGFRNDGSASSPSWARNAGWDLTNNISNGWYASPALADLDNDGDFDLLVGRYLGTTYAYRNDGSASSPTWTYNSSWNAPDVGDHASPASADLDSDGDYDLMIANLDGIAYGYRNTGSASSPTWSANAPWNSPGAGAYTAAALGDLDNDEDYDLLLGEQYGVSYAYQNGGTVTFNTPGTFVSSSMNVGPNYSWGNLSWTHSNGQTITMKARSDADGDFSNATAWGSCSNITSGNALSTGGCVTNGHQYVQYQATLSTADTSVTPSLDDVTVTYNYYPTSQTLTSSPFNSGDAANVLGRIYWTEDTSLPSGTNVRFQLRTASTQGGLSSATFIGPNGTNSDYFYNSGTGCAKASGVVTCTTLPSALTSGGNDQWFQYQASFTSTGANTPTLYSVTVQYVVNAAPEFQNVTASQGSNGIVTVNYEVRDIDTSTGVTANSVSISLQYCTASCTTPGSESWTNANTVSGNTGAGITVEESDWSSYSLTWNAKTDYDEQYNANGKIRLVADDSEGANRYGYGSSSNFALDTKDPSGVSFTIDNTTNILTLATPTEDSSYQMLVSNLSNFSGASAQTFQSSYTHSTLTSDPATVYLRIIDAKGNYTDATATTPAKPQNPVYYDTSNATTGEYREFVAWGVISASQVGSGFSAYKVYRSTDNSSFSLVATITNRNVNYHLDTGLSTGTTYYYKIRSEDTNGNISEYSSTINDSPDGQGGSDSTSPTITSVASSNITTTSATITWTTDELADSSVGYSTDTSYLPEYGNASMVTSHSIVLTGLTPDTSYNIRVKSRDSSSNLGQVDASSPGSNSIPVFSFTTLPGPAISLVTTPSLSNNQATITWLTTTDSNSYVSYATSVSGGALVSPTEVGSPTLVGGSSPYAHSVTLTGLTQGTRYYFSVKSTDASSNEALDNNGGEFYELVTTQDSIAPVISSLTVSMKTHTQAAISWVTDEPATSLVKYSTTSGGPYTDSTQGATYNRTHYVIISSLTANTTYYYTVTSADINGNSRTSSETSFITLKDPEFQHDPLTAISSISDPPNPLTDTKAVITFTTDQSAKCSIESGTQSGSYAEVPVSETDYNVDHSVHLTGLIFSTVYYYQIICADNLSNTVSSSEKSFTTSDTLYTESGFENLQDTAAPEITNVKTSKLSGESITITWDTDEKANSLVKYGITKDYERMEGSNLVNSDADNYVTSHEVIVSKLIPSTKYYYAVVSTDAAGNISESAQKTFTTSSPSSLSSIKVVSKNLNEATVTWKTSDETTSLVEYGLTEDYSEKKESTTLAKEHELTLASLNSGVTYHFRVKGIDKDNNLYSSADYTFEPKSPPKISGTKVEEVKEHSVSLSFATDVPTDALIVYSDKDNKLSGSQGNPQLSLSHTLELKNLVSGTLYTVRIKVRDESGNESEEVGPEFTTGKDENPPKIDQVRTDNALAQNDKVQTIISWITDEPGTTILIYKESRTGQEREITISNSFTPSHVAVITVFKPGQVYYFKVKSLDEAGNVALSGEYALLTPKRKENIVQVIINNFQDIFGWMRR